MNVMRMRVLLTIFEEKCHEKGSYEGDELDAVNTLIDEGFLLFNNHQVEVSAKGMFFIGTLVNVPSPIQQWIIPDADHNTISHNPNEIWWKESIDFLSQS